jgi:hypothetical protein
VRKPVADLAPAGSSLETDASANLVPAATKLPTPPIQPLWSQSLTGASLVNGVCILSSGADKSAAISRAVPPSHMMTWQSPRPWPGEREPRPGPPDI